MEHTFCPTIDLIIGPMGSGKTTELLRRIELYAVARKNVVLIKPRLDTRMGVHIGTHGFQTATAIVLEKLSDACHNHVIEACDVVGIDEGQFFPDLASGSEELAQSGKKVIIAGLSGTSERNGFSPIMEIIAKCDSITMLTAVCVICGRAASFTAHQGTMKGTVKIGDIGEYMPMCRYCFMERYERQKAEKEMLAAPDHLHESSDHLYKSPDHLRESPDHLYKSPEEMLAASDRLHESRDAEEEAANLALDAFILEGMKTDS